MANIPIKVNDRLTAGIKKFQPIIANAKSRDINESDTVILLTDIFNEVLGYDKYSEITSEYAIRSTYCDLAIKFNDKLQYLIEVKAIGLELKDNFVKQAVDYAANQGVDFVILTNGQLWRVYKVSFGKPIDQETVLEFNFLDLNYKNIEDIEKMYYLCKEGWMKSTLYDYHSQQQVLSKFFIGALIMTDTVINLVRRELRKMSPDIKINDDQIRHVIQQEVLKREVVEGEKADEARKKIIRLANKLAKSRNDKKEKNASKDLDSNTEECGSEETND